MKVAILAGGLGSRIAEETEVKPKPMIEIGGEPILWHIMRYYAHFGFREFVIALGYKGEYIKRYATDFATLSGDLEVDYTHRRIDYAHANGMDGWSMKLVQTGLRTETGGRVKRLRHVIGNERFLLTYGDGLSNVDISALVAFHKSHGKLATLTAVRPPARYGHIELDGDKVTVFDTKLQANAGWINGAFFVLEPRVFDYIEGDQTQFEREPLHNLAMDGELMAYLHEGFWQCMDTIREKVLLERMWEEGLAPWKVW
jgi:glucose-1-phosphate cytidylyltransferase